MTHQLYKFLLELFRSNPFFDGMAKPLSADLSFMALMIVSILANLDFVCFRHHRAVI